MLALQLVAVRAAGAAAAGAYASDFGSAVGILLLGLLTLFVADAVQRLNAVKILLAGLAAAARVVVAAILAVRVFG